MIYSDDNQRDSSSADISNRETAKGILKTVAISKIVGDAASPDLLQQGDVAEITVTLNTTTAGKATILNKNQIFRLELIPQQVGSLIISRKTPPELMKVMNLE